MGFKKTIGKGAARISKQLTEPGRNLSQTEDGHSSVPDSARQTMSPSKGNSVGLSQTGPYGNLPTPIAASYKRDTSSVPSHVAPLNAATIPKNHTSPESRTQVTRKPTALTTPEDTTNPINIRPKASDKKLPSPQSVSDPEMSQAQTTAASADDTHDMQSHGLGSVKDAGKTLGQAVDEQSMKMQEQAREIQALRHSNCQHVNDLETIKKTLQEKQEEYKRLEEKHAQLTQVWRKQTVALSAIRHEASHKVDDDFLRSHYTNIAYEVSSWVSSYCVSTFDRLPESELRIFNTLTSHPRKYYRVDILRELLLQSLVMHELVELVLSFDGNDHKGSWWAGKQSIDLRSVQLALEPPDEPHDIPNRLKDNSLTLSEVRDYSAWKAKTALLFSEKVKPPALKKNIGCVLGDMQKLLGPFVPRTMWTTAWKDLETVIHKTIALDLELNKSRALFQVHRWSIEKIEEMRFDDICMGTPIGLQAARRGANIELILAPMITKTGNADGEAFESLFLMSPWMVVCHENRKQMEKQ